MVSGTNTFAADATLKKYFRYLYKEIRNIKKDNIGNGDTESVDGKLIGDTGGTLVLFGEQ